MTFSIVKSAYGRRYKTAAEAEKDWNNGLDFYCSNFRGRPSGQYCSIRDFAPGDKVEIRYGIFDEHLTMVAL